MKTTDAKRIICDGTWCVSGEYTPCTFAPWCLPFLVRVRPFTYTIYYIIYTCVYVFTYWENLKVIYVVFVSVSDLWNQIRSSNSARIVCILSPLILYVYNIIAVVVFVVCMHLIIVCAAISVLLAKPLLPQSALFCIIRKTASISISTCSFNMLYVVSLFILRGYIPKVLP